jgi:NAD(P)-dependent dehydrogenase (short-subunit alcohol dehydrogenase family)
MIYCQILSCRFPFLLLWWTVHCLCLRSTLILALSTTTSTTTPSTNHKDRPTVLVTGSTDGIGVTTAKNLCAKGYNVLIHGRDTKRIERSAHMVQSFAAAAAASRNNPGDPGTVLSLPAVDISTVHGCEQLVEHVKQICQEHDFQLTVLMNNAGVYSERHVLTTDGLELTFAVNVMAPFVITSLLLPMLLQQRREQPTPSPNQGGSRIVIASSISQCGSIRHWDDVPFLKRPYSAHGAYSESKLFDAMLSMEFASRLLKERRQDDCDSVGGLGTDRITCNCLDPGTVNTKMLYAGWGPCGMDVEAATDETWLCSSNEVNTVTGAYFISATQRRASSAAYDPLEREKLWNILATIAPKAAQMWDHLDHYHY